MKFTSNIKCGGCVAAVKPYLDQLTQEGNWQVELENPERLLTVEGPNLTPDEVIKAVESAGYRAELK